MVGACILGTGSVLPGRAVSTAEVSARAFPGRDPDVLVERTGISSRYWHDPERDSVASVAAETVRRALAAAGMEPTQLARLILCCSHGFDGVMPATANHVVAALGLRGECDAFDLNNTCMGFLSGFDMAVRCAATGLGPVAVVATELCSRVTSPEEPRPYAIMGDASGAVIVGAATDSGLLGWHYGNDGALSDSVTLDHRLGLARFGPTHKIANEVIVSVHAAATRAMHAAGVAPAEVDWFLLHQPNGKLYAELCAVLQVPESKRVPVVAEIGSVGSASIPVCLDRIRRDGRLRSGQVVLMAAVGSGLAYGAAVFRA